jgi:hypothetical protein
MLARAAPRTPSQRERAPCDPCGPSHAAGDTGLSVLTQHQGRASFGRFQASHWEPKVRDITPLVRNTTRPLATAATWIVRRQRGGRRLRCRFALPEIADP